MSNLILPEESNKRIYDKFKAYEDENFIKCSLWYSDLLHKIFISDTYEVVVDRYIEQLDNLDALQYDFIFDDNTKDLKENILTSLTQEEFTNTLIRTAYKLAKADVLRYDELEGDEY